MIIGVPKETFPGERRVALVPASVGVLTAAGHAVKIQSEAGLEAGYADQQYVDKGGQVLPAREDVFLCDCVVQVRAAGANPEAGGGDLELFSANQALVAMCDPLAMPAEVQRLAERGVNVFALELMPRISRAQSMDVLSSMATVAGYRAVLLAATALPKMFPMLTTAAGTITPAKVFVVGAGVAGLQAIASARRMGAVVSAYDVRAAVKEQVQSLGGRFVEMDLETGRSEGQGGYAQAMDENFYRRQRELMIRVVAEQDVVITTAAVPGKKAPILLTREMVEAMPRGSVVVDVAAERGGNCELTRPGGSVQLGGVAILGPANLPSEVPYHASQMFSKNVTTFLTHLVFEGRLRMDRDDEITRETLLSEGGHIVHPKVLEVASQAATA